MKLFFVANHCDYLQKLTQNEAHGIGKFLGNLKRGTNGRIRTFLTKKEGKLTIK